MSSTVLAMLNQPSVDAAPHTPEGAPFVFVDAALPQVSVLDLGVTRGDGVFETISVGHGRPQAFEHHLRRLAQSAATLDLPVPDLAVWRAAVLAVIATLAPDEEQWVKLIYTRGVEGDGRPTGWVYGAHAPDNSAVRVTGVSVVTLDRGYRHDVEKTSPWLLQGAKTLSYAINRSVFREAARRGADDVIFVSSDGYVLEGPTSTVIFRRGNELVTPGTGLGILDGTTQANVFRFAESRGMSTGFALATPANLTSADAVWLVSSVRLLAPVRSIDGLTLDVDAEFTADANAWLKLLED